MKTCKTCVNPNEFYIQIAFKNVSLKIQLRISEVLLARFLPFLPLSDPDPDPKHCVEPKAPHSRNRPKLYVRLHILVGLVGI
jgi:hypothetical protein